MNIKNTYGKFSSVFAAFIVLFVYVGIIFNKYFNLVAIRIYKTFIFVLILPLLSYQQQVVLIMSQIFKIHNSPFLRAFVFVNN